MKRRTTVGNTMEVQQVKDTMFSVCLTYVRQRIAQTSPDQHAAIFRAACYIFAPYLRLADARTLCTAVGLSSSYIHTYHAALKQWRQADPAPPAVPSLRLQIT